jgi:hypothetical protein
MRPTTTNVKTKLIAIYHETHNNEHINIRTLLYHESHKKRKKIYRITTSRKNKQKTNTKGQEEKREREITT